MAGPHIALRNKDGRPLLAWGSDHLRADPALRPGYQAIVLTAGGIQDPSHRLEAQGLRVLRCGYQDSPDLAQAQRAVLRCAPQAAEWVTQGIPTLVVCAAGENRSGLMTARIRWLVTGEPGSEITRSMRATAALTCPGRPRGCTFTNNVFRRWADTWPAQESAPLSDLIPGALPPWVGLGLGIALAGAALLLLWKTVRLRTANRRRYRRRRALAA